MNTTHFCHTAQAANPLPAWTCNEECRKKTELLGFVALAIPIAVSLSWRRRARGRSSNLRYPQSLIYAIARAALSKRANGGSQLQFHCCVGAFPQSRAELAQRLLDPNRSLLREREPLECDREMTTLVA